MRIFYGASYQNENRDCTTGKMGRRGYNRAVAIVAFSSRELLEAWISRQRDAEETTPRKICGLWRAVQIQDVLGACRRLATVGPAVGDLEDGVDVGLEVDFFQQDREGR
jgi:hypothetical protein